ncbi:MAG: glycosyltransferase family 39 protein [Candidatus Dojkabacteria bacterium]
MKALRKWLKENRTLALPVTLVVLLTGLFASTLPYLDGNIDFVQSMDFFEGGFDQLIANWASIHPPFKVLLGSTAIKLFGVSHIIYNLIGITISIIGVVFAYLLGSRLFSKKVGLIFALLISTSPLYLSLSLFWLKDFVLAVVLLATLFLYLEKRYLLLGFTLMLAVMIKEQGLALAGAVIATELLFGIYQLLTQIIKRKKLKLKANYKKLLILLPFLVFIAWQSFLSSNGSKVWGDWIFTNNPEIGAIATVINNLVSLDFLNQWAFQNWNQLLILNFNWVLWGIFLTGPILYLWTAKRGQKRNIVAAVKAGDQKIRVFAAMLLFFLGYFLTVLTFQTYTITRYGLPLIPILLLGVAYTTYMIIEKSTFFGWMVKIILPLIVLTSLFSSSDPVSKKLWGTTSIFEQELYAVNEHLAGNDGLTYNLQFLQIAKQRSESIFDAHREQTPVYSQECYWVFADPNNDVRTLAWLGLDGIQNGMDCQVPATQSTQ